MLCAREGRYLHGDHWLGFLFHSCATGEQARRMQVQAVLSLLPVMRFKDELKERQGCCYAHHHPVDGNKQRPLDQAILATLHATNEVGVDIEEVTKDETERAH